MDISDNGNDSHIMMKYYSQLKTHRITVELDLSRHEALIFDMDIQSFAPVELAIMMKNMVTELKKMNINYIIQQVTKSDWTNILEQHGLFKFVNENETYGYLNVKCQIDNFPEAVMKGLGF